MKALQKPDRAVSIWLLAIVGMIALMVVLGGITRLTGSGLSMVEWHPLMGAIPPLNESAWMEVFEQYQQSPQYQRVNDWMGLADFKKIFLWEYLHRLCGRLLGLVFFLPFFFFLKTKRLQGQLARKTFVAFVLGGLQGLLGWYMVKSGLADRPSVSHFRLAAHLSLAFVTALYVLWIWMVLHIQAPPKRDKTVLRAWIAIGLLVGLQVVYGAFMAGLKAGLVFPQFPTIDGSLFPFSKLAGLPLGEAALWSPAGVHLIHRALGWLLLLVLPAAAFWTHSRATETLQKRLCIALGLGILAQFTLGALTILKLISIPIAVAHQLGALLICCLILANLVAFGLGTEKH